MVKGAPSADALPTHEEFPPVLDALNDPVLASGEDGSVLYANAAAERLLGWKRDELLGKPLTTIMPRRLHAAHEAGFHRFMTTGQSKIIGRPIRVPALHHDGFEIEVELTLSEVPGRAGPTRVIAVLRDLRGRIELERKIAAQRKILAQYAAVAVLADSGSAAEAMPRILEATAQALGWDLGIYWAIDPGSRRLAVSATWSSGSGAADEFLVGCLPLTFGPGEALPGIVLATGEAVWSRDVRSDARYGRAALAAAHGFRSALLFPVYCSHRTWGVLEYVSSREEELDEELRQTMNALGFQIGQFLERMKSEEDLRHAWAQGEADRQNLQEAEERLRLAVEAAEVGTWDYDPRSGALRADARYRRLFGLGPDVELTSEVLRAAIHPDDEARVLEAVRRSFDARTGGEYVIEYRTRGVEDGLERWVAMRGRMMFDERARPVRFVGTGIDVTREKQAVERLRFLAEASKILSSGLDYRTTLADLARLAVPRLADWCAVEIASEEGLLEEGAIAHVDPTKVELARELRRRYPPELVSASAVARVFATGQPAFIPEVTEEMLVHAARDDDHLRLMRELEIRSAMFLPLKSRERTLAVLGLFQAESGRRYVPEDLTFAEEVARRAAVAVENARLYARATKAIGVRDEFLSIASHELRTPLTSLSLQLSGLMRLVTAGRIGAVPADKLGSRIELMDHQVRRLAGLVDELLDVSRISSGRLEVKREPMDLVALVKDVAARLAAETTRAGASIVIYAPVPVMGTWDGNRLDQVVTNLIANALKYAPGKPIHVAVSRRDGTATVEVRDMGPGISENDQKRIFGQFERAAPPALAGLGLGLWIASRIVEAHGGLIEVASRPGEGATFSVHLPMGSSR